MKTGNYTPDKLKQMNGYQLEELVKELHEAIIGLLWLIDDLKNFDDSSWESHFDNTVPVEHAQRLHRLLMTQEPEDVMEMYDTDDYLEFDKWWHRCNVGDSFYKERPPKDTNK